MLNNYIEVIDRMHSYSSMMDKISRMSYLRGEQNHLEEMSRQLFLSYRIKGYLTPAATPVAMSAPITLLTYK